ncbi:DUF805 domain-containing protein [Geopseudomonas aromaticivorans]
MEWYLSVLKKYATFSGRARRKEFWMFALISTLISIALTVIDVVLGWHSSDFGVGVTSTIYSLSILLPYCAVTARRLHDTNRSAWWMFGPVGGYLVLLVAAIVVVLIAGDMSGAAASAIVVGIAGFLILIMSIAVFVFLCLDGTPGENRFGANPKEAPATAGGLSLNKPVF